MYIVTDTDSLCIESEEDFYKIMHKFNELFDLSNFSKDRKYFCNDNKKVPRKMKDEYEGTVIYEFVGPKPKMYLILDVNNCDKSVYKCHNSDIRHDDFMGVYPNENVITHIMNRIKSFSHRMHTYKSKKISLSVFDDKYIFLMME